jgi:hypothetical protein
MGALKKVIAKGEMQLIAALNASARTAARNRTEAAACGRFQIGAKTGREDVCRLYGVDAQREYGHRHVVNGSSH